MAGRGAVAEERLLLRGDELRVVARLLHLLHLLGDGEAARSRRGRAGLGHAAHTGLRADRISLYRGAPVADFGGRMQTLVLGHAARVSLVLQLKRF